MSTVLELVGLVLAVAAFATLGVFPGLLSAGVAVFIVGVALDEG